jgi:hypothetical protein
MPYVHLANGEVIKLTAKELKEAQEQTGTIHAFNREGVQHHVIGVYPDETELPKKDDDNE